MHENLKIQLLDATLEGALVLPDSTTSLVIFSHGSGSSRFSPRNNFVAQQLQRRGIGTFLFDLLTEDEDRDYNNRFNIMLLSKRLADVTEKILRLPDIEGLPVGYFGASTGAASAMVAAIVLKNKIHAVVSRGGRPDLVMEQLSQVQVPTLLIVGGLDDDVIKLNKKAFNELSGEKRLEIIDGATHLFEEPGTLEQVAELSIDWFLQHLTKKELAH